MVEEEVGEVGGGGGLERSSAPSAPSLPLRHVFIPADFGLWPNSKLRDSFPVCVLERRGEEGGAGERERERNIDRAQERQN